MTKELFDQAVKDGRPVCYYLFRDLGLEKDCKYFVETGTHEGHSVQFALDLGFDEVLSCEFMNDRYDRCMERSDRVITEFDYADYLWDGQRDEYMKPVELADIPTPKNKI